MKNSMSFDNFIGKCPTKFPCLSPLIYSNCIHIQLFGLQSFTALANGRICDFRCPDVFVNMMSMSLLNCAPCAPSHLRALPIIDKRLRTYALCPSLICALRALHTLRACTPMGHYPHQ